MGSVSVEVSRDKKIRRYMSIEIFEKLLESKTIYFSRFDSFEDQLEGGLTSRNYSSISNSAEVFDSTVNEVWPAIDRRPQSPNVQYKFEDDTFLSIFGEQKKINGDAYLRFIRSWLYANCWTDLPHECQAMWQLYGSSGSNCRHSDGCVECQSTVGMSVCIETTVGALIDQITMDNRYELIVRKVEYIDHDIKFFSIDDLIYKPYFSKAMYFAYENEVRFLLHPVEKDIEFSYKYNASSINDVSSVSLPLKDLGLMIERVVLSPIPHKEQKKIEEEHMKNFGTPLGLNESLANKKLEGRVRDICQRHGVNVTIENSSMNKRTVKDLYSLMELSE